MTNGKHFMIVQSNVKQSSNDIISIMLLNYTYMNHLPAVLFFPEKYSYFTFMQNHDNLIFL